MPCEAEEGARWWVFIVARGRRRRKKEKKERGGEGEEGEGEGEEGEEEEEGKEERKHTDRFALLCFGCPKKEREIIYHDFFRFYKPTSGQTGQCDS